MNYSLLLRLSYHYFIVIRTQQETNAIVRLHNANGEKQFMSNLMRIIENVKCSLYMYDVLNSNLMVYSDFCGLKVQDAYLLPLFDILPFITVPVC